MTLIAGFHSFGTPVLIGDLLTSNHSGPVGLRKKILLINKNCAVAWTGHLRAAASVINDLQNCLGTSAVTLEAVKHALMSPSTSDLGSLVVRLIGWVVDERGSHCFLWNSLNPTELFLGAPQYDGSGEGFALGMAGPKGLHHSEPPTHSDPHEVDRGALGVTTQAMHYEIWGPSTKSLGFGHAYEILRLVDNSHFVYLDNALYVPVGFELDENGRYLRAVFGPKLFKYHAHNNCSVIHIHDPITKHQDIHLVTPPGPDPKEAEQLMKTLTEDIKSRAYKFPLASEYYCCAYQLRSPIFVSPPFSSVFTKSEAETGPFTINTEGITIQVGVSREWVEWSYKVILEDQEKSRKS